MDKLEEILGVLAAVAAEEQAEIKHADRFLNVVNPEAVPGVFEDVSQYKAWCSERLRLLCEAHSALLALQSHRFPDRPLWRVKHESIDAMNGIISLIGAILPRIEEYPVAEIIVGEVTEVVNADA